MPAKRFPIFILIVISVLATWYNFDSLLQLREGKVKLSLPLVAVDEPEPDAVAELTKSPIEPLTALPAPSPPILNPSPVNDTRANPQGPDPALLASDVLLIIKTGASTFWRRMPLHLTTTLSNGRIPNAVIYSDLQEQLSSSIEAVDALANVSDILQKHDPPAYASYLEQQSPDHVNTYREHGRLPGDEPPHEKAGNTPGWLLDKYKFLPMLAHAQKNWPGLKWYIYIEDDTFIFLHNLLQWLSTLPTDDEPCYYGAYSGGGNDTFAQGGSGIVFSRSLMRSVFGGDKTADLEGYGNYTSKACCGDIALGKVLRDYDIYVNRGDYGPVAFRPEPPWKTGFDELIWCSPVFTFHHLHQRDLVQLARLEETQRSSNPSRPTIFRDVFTALILPHLANPERTHWDNFASKFVFKANSTIEIPSKYGPSNGSAFEKAFHSPATCRAACLALEGCFSWRHESAAAECGLDIAVKLGREPDPLPSWATKTEVVSGWILERINERLLKETCDIISPP